MVNNSAHALEIARQLINLEADAVRAVADQIDTAFLETVDLALAATGKIFTVGSGTSGMIARRLAHLLSVCGSASIFLHPMDALHGSSGALESGDVVIAISKGGESQEINQLLTLAKSRGVKVVALTAKPESSIAAIADTTVVLHTSDNADPGGVIAMGSTLVTAVWGDALAYVLMHYNGYSWNEVLEAHPAGAVGKITEEPDSLPKPA
jgi:arabinose-5-phosphate isomerase